ncbi:hypothetical protein DM01DRAFT_1042251 [Hesseltinella vesiculosa]|uniref:ERT1/acuK family PAS domain-containing protein n=1 Tax=Hesseltinella vesiculosa TaxID=101127 RepID=A0A1X2GHN9_9FUNG|nr:hypothetical protein DM01DRAFT_1042251 [Hesseltinella vesiculosa]
MSTASKLEPSTAAIDYLSSFNLNLGGYDFGSQMASLEYGFLGDMVQTQGDPPTALNWTPSNQFNISYNQPNIPNVAEVNGLLPSAASTVSPTTLAPASIPAPSMPDASTALHPTLFAPPATPATSLASSTPLSLAAPLPTPTTSSATPPSTVSPIAPSQTPIPARRSFPKIAIDKPFNYAEGFHYLIQYVQKNMNRVDLMRISRALAKFRPSFLVLIMNLTEEDLIFMEKCIQRTLLEYEKLINFSGTPTAVWRRTGEICLLGKEFCLLTQWTKEMILNKKTYIYELMDCASAVEYWENFSRHAFDNTDTSRYYSCVLLSPQNKPIPCTFCFMIKRDIFDLPSVIVGNFLPILS